MTRHAAQPDVETSIPDKLYFRIGEVAKLCDVETYVLRFWETEFPQLKPNKGGTGQRLYRRRDVEMALRIKRLLHEQGYTIAGARQVFASEDRGDAPPKVAPPERPPSVPKGPGGVHPAFERMRLELKDLLRILSHSPVPAPRDPKTRRTSTAKEAGPTLFGL